MRKAGGIFSFCGINPVLESVQVGNAVKAVRVTLVIGGLDYEQKNINYPWT
jgi:hypothetical protein